jgi:hypothetical protein
LTSTQSVAGESTFLGGPFESNVKPRSREDNNFRRGIRMLERTLRLQPRLFARAMRLQNITGEGRSAAHPLGRLYPLCSYVHRLPRLQTVSKKYSTDDCIESDCSSAEHQRALSSRAARTRITLFIHYGINARSTRAILLPCSVMNR